MTEGVTFVATKSMGNTSPLKPLCRRSRSAVEVRTWEEVREAWITGIAPTSHFHRLFDTVPGLHFFAKNREGHLMFASRGLRERYSMHDESEILNDGLRSQPRSHGAGLCR